MTIRFAPARRCESSLVARLFQAPLPMRAANDNVAGVSADKLMTVALRHFATHGLCAAERAREAAEKAFFAGDAEGYRQWLGICRLLDRRMADAVAARQNAGGFD